MNIKLLSRNPEFARNIKLELTNQRLFLMPIILLLLTIMFVNFNDEYRSYQYQNQYDHLATMAMFAFAAIVYLWGAKSAADSVLEEYNDRTWDWQRMSIIGPYKMTIGKLFGSTAINWYGGLIIMVIFLFASVNSLKIRPTAAFISLAYGLLTGITVQGLSMLAALMQIKKGEGRNKIKSTSSILIAILTMWFFFNEQSSLLNIGHGDNLENDLFWYGLDFGPFIILLKPLFCAVWIVIGLYRTMGAELQYAHGIKYWVLFLSSLAIFIAGYFIGGKFSSELSLTTVIALIMLCVTSIYFIITFILTLAEPKEFIQYKICYRSFKVKNYKRFYETAPLWSVTLVFTFFGVLITTVILSILFNALLPEESAFHKSIFDSGFGIIRDIFRKNLAQYYLVPIAALGFLCRDILIILLVNYTGKRKRADATAMLFLALLYLVAPNIVRDENILPLFYPVPTGGNLMMIIAPWLEVLVLFFYFRSIGREDLTGKKYA